MARIAEEGPGWPPHLTRQIEFIDGLRLGPACGGWQAALQAEASRGRQLPLAGGLGGAKAVGEAAGQRGPGHQPGHPLDGPAARERCEAYAQAYAPRRPLH